MTDIYWFDCDFGREVKFATISDKAWKLEETIQAASSTATESECHGVINKGHSYCSVNSENQILPIHATRCPTSSGIATPVLKAIAVAKLLQPLTHIPSHEALKTPSHISYSNNST
jgi:hypothetical protein